MAVSHGKAAIFQYDNAAGSLTDISTSISSITFTPTSDSAETSTLGTTSKSYIPGLKDCTISLTGLYNATISAVFNSALGNTTTKTFQYDPQGSTTGLDRWTGESFVTSFAVDTNLGGAATWSADIQVTGAVTLGAVP